VGASATSVSNISDRLTASKGGQDSSESPRFSWQGSEAFYSTRQWQLVRSPCRTGPSGSQPLFDFVSFLCSSLFSWSMLLLCCYCCPSMLYFFCPISDRNRGYWLLLIKPSSKTRDSLGRFSGQIQGKIDKSSYHVKPTVQKPKSLLTSALSLARASSPTVHCQWIDVHTPGRCQKCLGHVMSCWGHIRMYEEMSKAVKCCQMIQTSMSQGKSPVNTTRIVYFQINWNSTRNYARKAGVTASQWLQIS
jgi:hypothetical protein